MIVYTYQPGYVCKADPIGSALHTVMHIGLEKYPFLLFCFLQQIFIEQLLCSRLYERHQAYYK